MGLKLEQLMEQCILDAKEEHRFLLMGTNAIDDHPVSARLHLASASLPFKSAVELIHLAHELYKGYLHGR